MEPAARVAAAETGWGQRPCPQPETPALSYSREQVTPRQGWWAGPGILPFALSQRFRTVSFPSYLVLKGERDSAFREWGAQKSKEWYGPLF